MKKIRDRSYRDNKCIFDDSLLGIMVSLDSFPNSTFKNFLKISPLILQDFEEILQDFERILQGYKEINLRYTR